MTCFDSGNARLVLTPDNDYLRYLQRRPPDMPAPTMHASARHAGAMTQPEPDPRQEQETMRLLSSTARRAATVGLA